MTKPTTLRWTKLSIWPGDGASPEDFTSKVCGLISKGFSLTAQTSDSVVPDCDDPDLPAWTERVVRALSGGVTGAGLMAEETFAFWRDWFLAGTSKNVRIVVDLATTPGYFACAMVLTKFDLTGNETDGKVQISLALDTDGAVTWTAGAP